jgi:hypothetical protein
MSLEPHLHMNPPAFSTMPFSQPTNVDHLPRERVQAFLDDLADLTARHGIVIHCGSLAPRGDDIGGYRLATGGYLHAYPVGDREGEVARANLPEVFAQRRPRTMTSDIAGITAHDLIRRSRRPGAEDA